MNKQNLLDRVEEYGTVFFFSLMSVLISVGVFLRYVLGKSLVGVTELAILCFIWATFWGASLCLKRAMHLKIDTLVRLLPSRVVNYLDTAISIGICVFLVSLIRTAIQLVQIGWDQLSPELHLRLSYYSLALLSSSILMLFHSIGTTFSKFRDIFRRNSPLC